MRDVGLAVDVAGQRELAEDSWQSFGSVELELPQVFGPAGWWYDAGGSRARCNVRVKSGNRFGACNGPAEAAMSWIGLEVTRADGVGLRLLRMAVGSD